MTKQATIIYANQGGIGYRPLVNRDGQMWVNADGWVQAGQSIGRRRHVRNSALLEREWALVDDAVALHPRVAMNAMNRLIERQLIQPVQSVGPLTSNWRTSSEKRVAEATLNGRTTVSGDNVARGFDGVVMPIIASPWELDFRTLENSRLFGEPLDVSEARESAQAVVEKQEDLMFNGDTNLVVGGMTIYGMRTHPNRLTDTATNYGGGDFATTNNAYNTLIGVFAALDAIRRYGQLGIFLAQTQYNQLNVRNTQTDRSEMMAIMENLGDRIAFIDRMSENFLPAGEMCVLHLDQDDVDVAVAMDVTNREWSGPDSMDFYGKVMAATTPRFKKDFSGNLGVVHVTGC